MAGGKNDIRPIATLINSSYTRRREAWLLIYMGSRLRVIGEINLFSDFLVAIY
jgi:hypothetical protein